MARPSSCSAEIGERVVGPVFTYVVLKHVGFRLELDRVRDAVSLVFVAAFAPAAVSATAGLGLLVIARMDSGANFASRWFLIALGSALGVLIVTPLLLVLRHVRWPRSMRPVRVAEVVALVAGTSFVMLFAVRRGTDLLFLVFPFLIWAALRFRLAGAAPCALIASAIAVYGITPRVGEFVGSGLVPEMITLVTFIATTTLTSLVLAVVIAERNQAQQEIRETATQLLAVVHMLDRRLRSRVPTHFDRR